MALLHPTQWSARREFPAQPSMLIYSSSAAPKALPLCRIDNLWTIPSPFSFYLKRWYCLVFPSTYLEVSTNLGFPHTLLSVWLFLPAYTPSSPRTASPPVIIYWNTGSCHSYSHGIVTQGKIFVVQSCVVTGSESAPWHQSILWWPPAKQWWLQFGNLGSQTFTHLHSAGITHLCLKATGVLLVSCTSSLIC